MLVALSNPRVCAPASVRVRSTRRSPSVSWRFLRAARAVWKTSCGTESLEWGSTGEVLKQERLPGFDPGIAIEVVPEVAAQAVGYARSKFRDPGLHLLIDVWIELRCAKHRGHLPSLRESR